VTQQYGKNAQSNPGDSLTGSVAYSLRVALLAFVRSLKLLAYELAMDVGPFTKSAASFRPIAENALHHLSRHLDLLASLRVDGHVQELDAHLTGVRALCRHFREEVLRPLASVDEHDEPKARSEMARIGQAVTGILRTAGLELDSLDSSIELIAIIRDEHKPLRRAVVSVDLWHYGGLVRLASDVVGISGVAELNQQIETLIKESVEAVGAPVEDALVVIVGDGATLVFDAPVQAYEFAEQLHRRTDAQNAAKKGPEGNKYFRVGVRFGDILLRKLTIGGKFVALNLVPCQISIDELSDFGSPMLPHDRKSFSDREIHDGQEVCHHLEWRGTF